MFLFKYNSPTKMDLTSLMSNVYTQNQFGQSERKPCSQKICFFSYNSIKNWSFIIWLVTRHWPGACRDFFLFIGNIILLRGIIIHATLHEVRDNQGLSSSQVFIIHGASSHEVHSKLNWVIKDQNLAFIALHDSRHKTRIPLVWAETGYKYDGGNSQVRSLS